MTAMAGGKGHANKNLRLGRAIAVSSARTERIAMMEMQMKLNTYYSVTPNKRQEYDGKVSSCCIKKKPKNM